METLDVEEGELTRINEYLNLIKQRANGRPRSVLCRWTLLTCNAATLRTPATWIRNFVLNHPAYKHDSVVSKEINYDMMVAIDEMYVHSCVKWWS